MSIHLHKHHSHVARFRRDIVFAAIVLPEGELTSHTNPHSEKFTYWNLTCHSSPSPQIWT